MTPEQIGKALLMGGILLAVTGIGIIGLGKLGLFKLPGDIRIENKHFGLYFPIMSCIVLSVFLTVIMWLINHFRK